MKYQYEISWGTEQQSVLKKNVLSRKVQFRFTVLRCFGSMSPLFILHSLHEISINGDYLCNVLNTFLMDI